VKCPHCGGSRTHYALFSGGREMYCKDCEDNFTIPEDAEDVPRRVMLMRTEEGRKVLRSEMEAELQRRRGRTKGKRV
jgi:hypothetical protein